MSQRARRSYCRFHPALGGALGACALPRSRSVLAAVLALWAGAGCGDTTGSGELLEPSLSTLTDPLADLSVTIEDDADPALTNGTVKYTVTMTNHGPDLAYMPVIGITPASGSPGIDAPWGGGASWTGCSGQVCFYNDMAAGETATMTFQVTASTPGTIGYTATASLIGQVDPDPSDDTVIEETVVRDPNVAPVVTSITLPSGPLAAYAPAAISASFTDENPSDTHTATIDWGAGTTTGNVTETDGSGTVQGAHAYSAPGLYNVTVTVSDAVLSGTRSSTQDVPAYIVVYDPDAGSVTGGGWIDSPAGACQWSGCAGNRSTAGKATFGFVARYRKRATVPEGNAGFEINAGGLRFKGTSSQWLVISGARATFRGEGRINGSGTYGFMITVVDGGMAGGGGADRFRIKIWDRADGDSVVYDNQPGEADDSAAGTVLGGGSIAIHVK